MLLHDDNCVSLCIARVEAADQSRASSGHSIAGSLTVFESRRDRLKLRLSVLKGFFPLPSFLTLLTTCVPSIAFFPNPGSRGKFLPSFCVPSASPEAHSQLHTWKLRLACTPRASRQGQRQKHLKAETPQAGNRSAAHLQRSLTDHVHGRIAQWVREEGI